MGTETAKIIFVGHQFFKFETQARHDEAAEWLKSNSGTVFDFLAKFSDAEPMPGPIGGSAFRE